MCVLQSDTILQIVLSDVSVVSYSCLNDVGQFLNISLWPLVWLIVTQQTLRRGLGEYDDFHCPGCDIVVPLLHHILEDGD
jgi:hypothetical protein